MLVETSAASSTSVHAHVTRARGGWWPTSRRNSAGALRRTRVCSQGASKRMHDEESEGGSESDGDGDESESDDVQQSGSDPSLGN